MTDDLAPGAGTGPATVDPADAATGGDAELLGLIDRLAELLHRSDLLELEVESGGTGLILRKAVAQPVAMSSAAPSPESGTETAAHPDGQPAAGAAPVPPATPSVKAPLTGIFYASPAPGSAPYVQAGGEVAVGQVIGLIEAMKLFNEIKSDLAGRVVRVLPESGALVKAKQPLIEVEPL
ncbi:MAG: acetyl-CoA carboxylase, biotin carboxyl carrier protein [Chloroflexi bacterium]|nr:acetyl-CoA carboxylase, biotin carboxyl carrier protein [Chloroflexota bacterium]